ncbi:hypothetical protein [Nonlabens xiamenensis]|uniref:hypothetical protein n=1 Tax=Nonlabens xiamenensis TaxID=2341043 RepID=UPI000F60ECC2|nr:hypothetical protein [Nonlabens xiamenensis]
MSVYIDPRKTKKVEEKAAPTPTAEEWMEKVQRMDNEELGRKIVAGFGALFISPLVFMFFWNWIMPAMFGLPVLSYLKAFGLLVMARLIFKHD